MKKLYVKNLELNKKYSVDEITNALFKVNFKNPSFSNTKIRTYNDSNCLILDSGTGYGDGTNRSMEDISCIYNTYRKYTTITEVLKSIEKNVLKYNAGFFIFCPDIYKWVICPFSNLSNVNVYKYTYNYKDSNYYYDEKGNGKYSLRQILNYLNISAKDRIIIKNK